ncbi:MAG: histone deacetylase [Cytophagales bacterium]|nr:histone deacetylase [Cytophagales bacterium]
MPRIAYSDIYCHPLPAGHRFPMEKYELIPGQLLYEGTYEKSDFFKPELLTLTDAQRVHSRVYLDKLLNLKLSKREERKIGLPLSSQLIERELTIMQGTLECCHHALIDGVSLNIAGGTHHASSDRGEGFCLLNDVAIAAATLLDNQKARRVLVIDLDVHQGNGTAKIFENQERVFTFSMHGKDNYPLHKENSDLDIALDSGVKDEEYLPILSDSLIKLLKNEQPDFLFYVSGVDVLATDKLGKLSLSLEGCKERDRLVFDAAKRFQLPIVVSLGGGYSPQIKTIVEAHCNTFRLAKEMYE